MQRLLVGNESLLRPGPGYSTFQHVSNALNFESTDVLALAIDRQDLLFPNEVTARAMTWRKHLRTLFQNFMVQNVENILYILVQAGDKNGAAGI